MKKITIKILMVVIVVSSCYSVIANSTTDPGMQKSEQSIRNLLAVYKKQPQSYYVNIKLGYLYYIVRKYANADFHYKAAAKYNSKSVEPLLGLYLVNTAQKQYSKAESYCRQVIIGDSLNYYGNLYLTYSLMAQLKYTDAQKVVIKMLMIYPSDTSYLYALKSIYFIQGKKSNAQKIQNFIDIISKQ